MAQATIDRLIINSPYEEPRLYWKLMEGEAAECLDGRRPAGYFYRDPKAPASDTEHDARGQWTELALVNLLRLRVKEWRSLALLGEGRENRHNEGFSLPHSR